jgi:hypothetical protein
LVLEDLEEKGDILEEGILKEGSESDVIVYTRKAETAVDLLRKKKWDAIYLDFELGPKELNGGLVSAFLRDNPMFKPKKIVISSFGPEGRKQMAQDLPEAEVLDGQWFKEVLE